MDEAASAALDAAVEDSPFTSALAAGMVAATGGGEELMKLAITLRALEDASGQAADGWRRSRTFVWSVRQTATAFGGGGRNVTGANFFLPAQRDEDNQPISPNPCRIITTHDERIARPCLPAEQTLSWKRTAGVLTHRRHGCGEEDEKIRTGKLIDKPGARRWPREGETACLEDERVRAADHQCRSSG